eukprot:NODE_1470_length_1939_cov_123.752203_g1247_i0.p1 GENE.NODE_1470_length_1939_cov_123.752203_g1247_i0~~NODE_1470_length_1939_cov_123.752203_g1247_i0.p1  ORF type:complete len:566 (+),score=122.81 NODE_1470_length_1939_cov_123.752203_g1247_i0:61-1758(+)
MSNPEVEELKSKGNAAFQAGKNEEAVNWFTTAIKIDPTNHILYSNRSAAYCGLERYQAALDDANKTIEIKPDWAKGYARKGAALHFKKDFKGAIEAYKKGLELDPNNDACKKGLAELQPRGGGFGGAGAGGENPFAKIFGPDALVKIKLNPKLAPYLDEPDYVNMIKMIQANPQSVNMFLQDKRIMQTFATLCGLNAGDFEEEAETPKPRPPSPKREAPKPQPAKNLTPEEQAKKEKQDKADSEKDKGNEHYKKREFEKALECYNKAFEICPENVVYLINIAAVYFEQGKYDEVLKKCDEALEKGFEVGIDYKTKAKALARKGSAYHKLKDYDSAIAAFKSSLMENRIADTLNKLNAVEKEKVEAAKQAYFDEGKALEAKERGNEFFKNQKFPEAIKEYTEAINRNPNDATYYSNRAAAYMKMGEYPQANKDCEKALEINPDFVKVITRKAHIHFFLKEYHKALEWYEKGLKYEPNNEELRSGLERTLAQIQTSQRAGEVDEERVRRSMEDPEIRAILQDPVMQAVLKDLSEDPTSAQKHLANQSVAQKIQKLIAAGVISTGRKG